VRGESSIFEEQYEKKKGRDKVSMTERRVLTSSISNWCGNWCSLHESSEDGSDEEGREVELHRCFVDQEMIRREFN
jgi:hypothetical protein